MTDSGVPSRKTTVCEFFYLKTAGVNRFAYVTDRRVRSDVGVMAWIEARAIVGELDDMSRTIPHSVIVRHDVGLHELDAQPHTIA